MNNDTLQKATYILKNKDKDIIEFSCIQNKGISIEGKIIITEKISDVNVLNKDLIPLNLDKTKEINVAMQNWIENRKVPKNRKFVEEIQKTYDDKSMMSALNISYGLSLNDSFWIVPKFEKNINWKNKNLYDNNFDEAIELVAFLGKSYKVKNTTSSPEYTTNGMLKKTWHRDENGTIKMMKGNSKEYANGGKETYAEFYMFQVAKALKFEAIEYDLEMFHNQLVSSCKIFTSQNEGYVQIYDCLEHLNRDEISLKEIEKIYGKDRFADLMVFDALICNKDRHLGNFGMIYNNNTNELLRPAPIFDNGASILNLATKDELQNISEFMQKEKGYFGFTFEEQLKKYLQPRHLENLKNLVDFKFAKHDKYNLDDEWLEPVEKHLQNISKKIVKQLSSNMQIKRNETKTAITQDEMDAIKEEVNQVGNKILNSKNITRKNVEIE